MAAAIAFLAGGSGHPTDITGSGLGFFGASFGTSVQVGQYQTTTFITNGAGSVNGGTSTNGKYPGNSSGVVIDGGSEVQLSGVPVTSGSMNIRFTFDTVVTTQNAELRIFDRVDKDNDASGVTTQASQLVNGGSGVEANGNASGTNTGWASLNGSGTTMVLLNSPGSGGLSPSGASTDDTRHDWYVMLSASPDSIGSKTEYGIFVELEYL
ncbi:hypothetical protein LCGC14_1757410 [marine sediment metagenome]|uniref:Uncharacterized protein n=1 Tax=marine sediment metagenome TaxID=412755 RepID=A0A0F9H253_9ZZZZ